MAGPAACPRSRTTQRRRRELYIRKTSSYYQHLLAINDKFKSQKLEPIKLTAADENLEDEDILEMVNAGILPLTVVDGHVAQIWTKVFKSIKIRPDIVINDGGAIAAAIRQNSPLLKAKLDSFLKEKTVQYGFASWLRKRYYSNEKMVRRAYAPEDMQRFNELVGYFRRYMALTT